MWLTGDEVLDSGDQRLSITRCHDVGLGLEVERAHDDGD